MLYLCRVNGNNCYYVNLYEVADLGKAKAAGKRLMKKNGGDYRIYVCATIDGSIIEKGGYWEMTWANDWKYFNTPKYQDAYEGMEVEVCVRTSTNIKSTIEFGKIIDPEKLLVKLEDGRVLDYNNNPWEKDNEDKTYFVFIDDIYPIPVVYQHMKQTYSYDKNKMFERKFDYNCYGVFEPADREYKELKDGFSNLVAKDGCGSVTEIDDGSKYVVKGFKYVVKKDGVTSVEIHTITTSTERYGRF